MKVSIPYIAGSVSALLALYCGLSGSRLALISNARTAAIVLAVAGFAMCTFGSVGLFVGKAPAHVLSIAGYVLGALALLTAVTLLFGLRVPLLSEPKTALLILTAVIVVKVAIAKLGASWIQLSGS